MSKEHKRKKDKKRQVSKKRRGTDITTLAQITEYEVLIDEIKSLALKTHTPYLNFLFLRSLSISFLSLLRNSILDVHLEKFATRMLVRTQKTEAAAITFERLSEFLAFTLDNLSIMAPNEKRSDVIKTGCSALLPFALSIGASVDLDACADYDFSRVASLENIREFIQDLILGVYGVLSGPDSGRDWMLESTEIILKNYEAQMILFPGFIRYIAALGVTYLTGWVGRKIIFNRFPLGICARNDKKLQELVRKQQYNAYSPTHSKLTSDIIVLRKKRDKTRSNFKTTQNAIRLTLLFLFLANKFLPKSELDSDFIEKLFVSTLLSLGGTALLDLASDTKNAITSRIMNKRIKDTIKALNAFSKEIKQSKWTLIPSQDPQLSRLVLEVKARRGLSDRKITNIIMLAFIANKIDALRVSRNEISVAATTKIPLDDLVSKFRENSSHYRNRLAILDKIKQLPIQIPIEFYETIETNDLGDYEILIPTPTDESEQEELLSLLYANFGESKVSMDDEFITIIGCEEKEAITESRIEELPDRFFLQAERRLIDPKRSIQDLREKHFSEVIFR
ncbi:MAG: hypothetical protein JXR42_02960 [Gammaproteobacteria bacterium]|nr:hypothetical protein [Gammaproteobacteria bacterium]